MLESENIIPSKLKWPTLVYSLWALPVSIFFAWTLFWRFQASSTVSLVFVLIYGFLALIGLLTFAFSHEGFYRTYGHFMIAKLIIVVVLFTMVFGLAQVDSNFQDTFEKNIANHNGTEYLNYYQSRLQCCGLYSKSEYTEELPESCCEELVNEVCLAEKAYDKGCLKEYEKAVSIFTIIATVMLSIH